MEDVTVLKLASIGVTGALLSFALYLGHDGALLAAGLAILSGLAGFEAGRKSINKDA